MPALPQLSLVPGDCLEVMRDMAAAGTLFDAVVTDPPYSLGFMGHKWDSTGIANRVETWRRVYDLLPPGGHLLACGGTRTQHRMVCAIEDAGFEIRDSISWIYGQGFPKSHNVSVAIDKMLGAEREVVGHRTMLQSYGANEVYGDGPDKGGVQLLTAPATPEAAAWQGWGTALKPAVEMICIARKPLVGTVAANVLRHGTGGINIDASRVPAEVATGWGGAPAGGGTWDASNCGLAKSGEPRPVTGRWPANVILDGSDEVLEAFAAYGERRNGGRNDKSPDVAGMFGMRKTPTGGTKYAGDAGTAARFFYSAKASAQDRVGSKHPTVKPLALMRYLIKLVTPPGGTVLDPFAGSGTTLQAAGECGFDAVGIELEPEYQADIMRRLAAFRGAQGSDAGAERAL